MKQKKIPMRTCVVTREKHMKKDLIRVVKTPDNNFEIDTVGKVNGRGVYVKNDLEVFKKAKSKKLFDRALEATIPDSIYDDLIKMGEITK